MNPVAKVTIRTASVHCTFALKSPNHKIDITMITAGATAPRISHVNLPWCENRYRSFGPRLIRLRSGERTRLACHSRRLAANLLFAKNKSIGGGADRKTRGRVGSPIHQRPYCWGAR